MKNSPIVSIKRSKLDNNGGTSHRMNKTEKLHEFMDNTFEINDKDMETRRTNDNGDDREIMKCEISEIEHHEMESKESEKLIEKEISPKSQIVRNEKLESICEANTSKEFEKNNKHNTHLHNQIVRYENMLSKMNQEYEKLLFESTNTDKIIINLKRELNDLKVGSDRKINSLDAQLKDAKRDIEIKSNIIEEAKKNITELENSIASNLNQSIYANKNEQELRFKIEELTSKLLKAESNLRIMKEELYVVKTENENQK